MSVLNFAEDARRAFDAMRAGGIAILPMDVGYSLIGATVPALQRIFDTKRRAPSKLNAMLGNDDLVHDLYVLSDRGREVLEAITRDYELPLGAVAPCRMEHPFLRKLGEDMLTRSTKDGTLLMLLNSGKFHAEITRLSREHQVPLFGSSANLSLSGTKFDPKDIEPEVKAIADIIVDYGLMKYHPYRASSTILNIETLDVVRVGSCYENIASILARHFGVVLPPRQPA